MRWSPAGVGDDGYVYSVATVLAWWPEPEHSALLARWPHLAEYLGATWDEHRQRTEQLCAAMERSGVAVNQVAGNVADLEVFFNDRGVATPSVDDLLGYPDLRTIPGAGTEWPPARKDLCWCGSGRRYQRCCRALRGLVEPAIADAWSAPAECSGSSSAARELL